MLQIILFRRMENQMNASETRLSNALDRIGTGLTGVKTRLDDLVAQLNADDPDVLALADKAEGIATTVDQLNPSTPTPDPNATPDNTLPAP